MINNSKNIITYHADIVKSIFDNKKFFHQKQARIPIEKKIKILIKLQKIALKTRPTTGSGFDKRVWQI